MWRFSVPAPAAITEVGHWARPATTRRPLRSAIPATPLVGGGSPSSITPNLTPLPVHVATTAPRPPANRAGTSGLPNSAIPATRLRLGVAVSSIMPMLPGPVHPVTTASMHPAKAANTSRPVPSATLVTRPRHGLAAALTMLMQRVAAAPAIMVRTLRASTLRTL